MSRIYFHSPSGDAEVPGTERAWMGTVTDSLGMSPVDSHLLINLSTTGCVTLFGRSVATWSAEQVQSARLAVRHSDSVSDGLAISVYGVDLDPGCLTLNTALQLGSPAIRLMTRLHNQCEIHCWVDGPNRSWLADLIDAGLAEGSFRHTEEARGCGWSDVTKLLRSRDDEPVVTSYSVCDQFPNSYASTWMPAWPEGVPERWDALDEATQEERSERAESWYDLPPDEQWARGIEWLRAQAGGLELTPDQFTGSREFHFGRDLSWIDLKHWDAQQRVATAYGTGGAQ